MTNIKTDFCCNLPNREIIEISGSDREAFLQGIITQDTKLLQTQPIIYSLMLSPQGKYQFDFFIINLGDLWLIDIDASRSQAFIQRLNLFKLRSDVNISKSADCQVGVSSTSNDLNSCFLDPRLNGLGYRFYTKKTFPEAGNEIYENLRLNLGVPDSNAMIVDKSIPMEWGMDELGAISWEKGCYMGQELTARSRYVGEIRKRCFPISFKVPGEYSIGEKILVNGEVVGDLRATNGFYGLALLKIEALHHEVIIRDNAIEVHKQNWMKLPA